MTKPCRCDHCQHRAESNTCDCGHKLADHRQPFHSCSECLWCDEFRYRLANRKPR